MQYYGLLLDLLLLGLTRASEIAGPPQVRDRGTVCDRARPCTPPPLKQNKQQQTAKTN